MAGTASASMVESDGSCESENGNKRFNSGEEEDRLSALPDFLIHHILSFLPATDLVKTLILSKWWKYQWTHVPVLKFVPNHGMSPDQFSNFIDKTLLLHDCSNIDKFVINLKCFPSDPLCCDEFINLDLWIRYAVTKDVKELIVHFNDPRDPYSLPEFLFNNFSLVKLKLSICCFAPLEKVNWGSIKSLRLHGCPVENGGIEIILSDFFFETDEFEDCMGHDCINFVHQTILQVQHVQKLEIGRWLMEILSSSKDDGDCIGGLPDSVIHRIISFLPSTKDVFESDLYKMWQHDWIDVPILNFVSNEKFVIDSKDIPLAYLDPRLSLWLRFAAKKDVKELILDCDGVKLDFDPEYPLPQFLFNNSSLVKMKICACDFMPNMKVNWESLKSLHLEHSELGDQAIENVLAGSPLLECLELRCCGIQGALVIASNHLKTFVLHDFGKNCHHLEISCPNLESLIMRGNVGSTSIKLMNLPSSLHATLDLYVAESDETTPDDRMNLVEETMKQIMHVEKLEIELSRFSSLKSDIGS
ncbi:F-box/LRR-repeat protein At5g02910-like isoform X2 [Euphorbia lathyris]|uniref:F-box/LRR-repeat protein At5g02910-like isoform X2 n=1 Tax=Euphorbia lathyris TaxID=212925 RepID=UPI0033138930